MSEAVGAYGDHDVLAWMRSLVRPYGTAVLAVGLAAIATWLLWERLYPSLLPPFLAAVTVAAWVGGLRSGLAATALAVACAAWLTMTRGDVRELGLPQLLWAASFVLVSILASELNVARRRAEHLLRERDSRLRLVSEQIPGGLWSTDSELHFTTLLGAALTTVAAPGDHLSDLFPGAGDDFPPIVAHRQALAGRATSYELDWDARTYQCHVEPLRNVEGQIIGTVGVALDITDRKRFEQRLEEAKAEAEQATASKDRFLAMLSHELRTPLTPALAAATALEGQTALSPAVLQDLGLIRRSIELEAKLIDDLLDLSRIASGKLRLTRETTDVHAVIGNALEMCRAEMDDKHIELALELDAAHSQIWCDAPRLQQVFWNLVKNAVKFTPQGGTITIRSYNPASETAEEVPRVIVEVSDTGIGIEPDVLPHVFNAFEQGKASITRKFGGLGLGLAISRALVEAHDGTLTAHSEGRGRGATFRVGLFGTVGVVRSPGGSRATGIPSIPLKRLRILVVEDHADTRKLLSRLVRDMGHSVITADCVESALRVMESGPSEASPVDLLLSDLGLPDGSGLDLMRRIRQTRPDRRLKAIALTGHGMEEDVRRSRDAGFDFHLTKPITVQALKDAINDVVREKVPDGATPA